MFKTIIKTAMSPLCWYGHNYEWRGKVLVCTMCGDKVNPDG